MSEEISKNIAWNSRLEIYFCSTGEKAHGLAWIHDKCEALYSKRRTFIDLPVIVCSGVLGFLSVGSSSMFVGQGNISSIAVGIGSLFVSVLNTIGSYFQFAKRAEGHRIASIQYAKLYRFLNIEMSLPREDRMSAYELLKITKETFDRLQEISPMVAPEIIDEFKKTFSNEKYKEISKPEQTNGLEPIKPFVSSPLARHPSGMSLGTPLEVYQENPLNQQHRTPSQLPKRNLQKVGSLEGTSLEPHSQPNDLTIELPQVQSQFQVLEVSEPSSQPRPQ
jgi:hypothetical protein